MYTVYRMYKSGNLLYFFSWKEGLGVERPAAGELPIFISSFELVLWEQAFREIALGDEDFPLTLYVLRKAASV